VILFAAASDFEGKAPPKVLRWGQDAWSGNKIVTAGQLNWLTVMSMIRRLPPICKVRGPESAKITASLPEHEAALPLAASRDRH